ncbi:MAG: DUF6095 family protein [Flavobacteriaceae bacterium]
MTKFKKTDRSLLVKGLKTMGLTLLSLFIGPFLLHAGLSNPDKPLFVPLVVGGIGVCVTTIYLGFRGIKIIMDSIFK